MEVSQQKELGTLCLASTATQPQGGLCEIAQLDALGAALHTKLAILLATAQGNTRSTVTPKSKLDISPAC